MCLIPTNKIVYFATLVILLVCSGIALGDTLVGRNSISYGKVKQINKDNVLFAEGCDENNIKSVPLADIRLIDTNDQCTLPDRVQQFSGSFSLDSCSKENNQKQIVFIVSFNKTRIYASDLELKEDGTLTISVANSTESLRGPFNKVTLVAHTCKDKKDIPSTFLLPKELLNVYEVIKP